MKHIYRIIFTSVCMLALSVTLVAQELKKADKAFEKRNYYLALQHYQKALVGEKSKKTQGYINFRMGEAYYRALKYPQALNHYKAAVALRYNDPTKQMYGHYGDVLMMAGEYKQAQKIYKTHLTKNSKDAFARYKMNSAVFADTVTEKDNNWVVRNIQEINTVYGEFAPARWNDKFVFTSSRFSGGDTSIVYTVTGDGFEDLYETSFNEQAGVWKEPARLKGINTTFNDGSFAYDSKRNIAYVMQCNGHAGVQRNCNIYTSSYNAASNEWSYPEKFQHFSTDYSSGHPALANNGTTLYFVSNNPLGKGSTDIWFTNLDTINNKWTKPMLVPGEVNTIYEEMFPTYVEGKGLYFSSNGHIGYGGFDMFFAEKTYDGFAKPQALEKPFNSSADDFSYTPLTETTGVFASNRIGGVGNDDLYYYYYHAVKLDAAGTVVDTKYKPLKDVVVVVENLALGISDTLLTDENGKYTYAFMEPNNEYRIKAFKSGYFVPVPEYRFVNTHGMKEDLMIDSANGYNLNFVLDEMLKNKEYNIENIYYDLDKYDLRPASIIELDKIVVLLKSNPEVAIQINSHTDDRASGEYNRVLSNNRAKSVVDYLISQGIAPTRLAWQGWGKTALVHQFAKTEEEHQENRRTTFNIVNFDELQLGAKAIFYQDMVNRIKGGAYIPPATTGVYFRLQLNSSRTACTAAGFEKFRTAYPKLDSYCSQFADGYYRYLAGRFSTFEEAEDMKQKVDELGYNSMILAYNNYERISVNEALQMLRKNEPVESEEISEFEEIEE